MSQKINLNAYFDRIGFAGSIAPTLATLELIHALHPAAIPFENLNPLLGLPVSLELGDIAKKLVAERRGGYCYEHNLLLMAVLAELDYTVRPLAARVLWSDVETRDSHHMLLAVEISGATYIVDVGFGGMSPTGPLRLRADVEQSTPHETYRLLGGEANQWTLEAKLDDAWRPLYAFDLVERSAADYAASNQYLSTDPASGFTGELRVALSPTGARLALHNTRFTTHTTGGGSEVRQLHSVAELREVLSGPFGIQLPPADLLDPKLEAIVAAAAPAEG